MSPADRRIVKRPLEKRRGHATVNSGPPATRIIAESGRARSSTVAAYVEDIQSNLVDWMPKLPSPEHCRQMAAKSLRLAATAADDDARTTFEGAEELWSELAITIERLERLERERQGSCDEERKNSQPTHPAHPRRSRKAAHAIR